jgi:hypothetical protein
LMKHPIEQMADVKAKEDCERFVAGNWLLFKFFRIRESYFPVFSIIKK